MPVAISKRFRIFCAAVLLGLLFVSVIEVRLAIITGYVRSCIALTALVAVLNAVLVLSAVLRSRPRLRKPAGAIVLVLVGWAMFAGRQRDDEALRKAYIEELVSFRDVRYVWGGETRRGIDCSGLIRRAYYGSLARRGIAEANPQLLGPGLWRFWWRDMSAQAMQRGNYGYTRRIGHTRKLAGYDCACLKPGDLAVTDSSIHVMAYLGDGRWIEANPGDRKVVINEAFAGSRRPYFNIPVTFVRWRELE